MQATVMVVDVLLDLDRGAIQQDLSDVAALKTAGDGLNDYEVIALGALFKGATLVSHLGRAPGSFLGVLLAVNIQVLLAQGDGLGQFRFCIL